MKRSSGDKREESIISRLVDAGEWVEESIFLSIVAGFVRSKSDIEVLGEYVRLRAGAIWNRYEKNRQDIDSAIGLAAYYERRRRTKKNK